MDVELFDPDELRETLGRILFKIQIDESGRRYSGTGFFIHTEGYALTAFHNLPAEVLKDPAKSIKATFRGQPIELYWLLATQNEAEWQRRLDIAILKGPAGILSTSDIIEIAYLNPVIERPQRAVFWRGRQVAMMGYPLRNAFDAELVLGSFSATAPITDPKIIDVTGESIDYAFDSLAFGDDFQRNCEDIQGVSGCPVYDCAMKRIVAVEFAAWPQRQRVYATELSHVAGYWPKFVEIGASFPMPPQVRTAGGRLAFDTLVERKTRDFVGREWLTERLDAFFRLEECGYFVIEGDPGIGKTAFAAWLARERDYACHFNDSLIGVVSSAQFIRNISARLIERYCPEVAEPESKQCEDGTYLLDLFGKVSAKLAAGEKLVLVVDALDEAERPGSFSGNVLALPQLLPPRVYVVGTARWTKDFPLWSQTALRRERLLADSPENRQDVERLLRIHARRETFRARLDAFGVTEDYFVALLLDKSEGNFMYLYYVLPAIEKGEYSELEIDALPQGLVGYYDRHWRQIRGRDSVRWENVLLPVISVLAVAREALSIREIMDFVKRGFPEFAQLSIAQVRAVVAEWRPFLTEGLVDNRLCYRIYHSTFREFLEQQDEMK